MKQSRCIILALLFLGLPLVAAAQEKYAMVARMAWPRVVKEPGIAPVIVDFITERNFTGTIRVSIPESDSSSIVEQNFSVGGDPQRKGGGFRFEIPYPIHGDTSGKNEMLVTLLEEGRVRDKQLIILQPLVTAGMANPNVAIPTAVPHDDPNKPRFLIGVLSSRLYDLKISDNAQGSYGTVSLDPQFLPSDWRMYEGLDLLIVMDDGATRVGPRECIAISQWVQAGGKLLVSGDSMPAGRTDLPFARFFDCAEVPKDVVRTSFGLGQIARVPDRLGEIESSDQGSRQVQLGKILEQTNLFLDGTGSMNSYSGIFPIDRRQAPYWASMMRTWTALDRIPRGIVALFLLIFAIVVLVVERLILGWLRKRHWTWVTTIATVALFCYAASYISTAVRGRQSRVTLLTLHDFGIDSGGRHISIAAFTPSSSKTFAAAAPPGSIITRHTFKMFGATKTITRMNPLSVQFAHPVWGTTYLTSVTPHISDSPFKANLSYQDGILRGDVSAGSASLEPKRVFCRIGLKVFERGGNGIWRKLKTDDVNSPYSYYGQSVSEEDALENIIRLAPYITVPAGTVRIQPTPQPNYNRTKRSEDVTPPERTPEYGTIIAIVSSGHGLQVQVDKPIEKTLHIVRQRVEFSAKADEPMKKKETD